jgi:GT2 family glycosyltransferase
MDSSPQINVCIPYDPEANLGREYNRLMEESKREWVLFLDHDVYLLNPHWYFVCQEAIRKFPQAGIFTAFTNNCGCRFSRAPGAPEGEKSLSQHKRFAKDIFQKNGLSCSLINANDIPDKINGYFMMTSRTAWKKVGGFRNAGLFAVDTDYHRRMIRTGLNCYRIDGLYVFHLHERSDSSWIPGHKTSKELWQEYKAARAAQ